MNDRDRSQWIDNDEGLYNWQRRSGLNRQAFIRANRKAIDEVIENVTSGRKPAHYGAYSEPLGTQYGLGYMQGRGAS